MERGRKRILLVVLIILAVVPVQLRVRTTALLPAWDETQEQAWDEMDLQQDAGEERR